ncbi:MAG TPA: histidine phosphatase family protein [Anaerolineae bacterium]|nr:histidine phosphatase family protein [Anaerolineae bacterium]
MELVLIRHGESTWNDEGRIQGWTDCPLSDRGRRQAEKLAERLAGLSIAALYTSSLKRALETAHIVARTLDLPPMVDERLREYGVGDLEGLTIEEVKERYPTIYHGWQETTRWIPLPGEEGRAVFAQRVGAAMADIVASHPKETVAVVTHGGVIGIFLAQLLGLGWSERLPFAFDNASVSIIELDGHRTRVRSLNDTCHLREERRS